MVSEFFYQIVGGKESKKKNQRKRTEEKESKKKNRRKRTED